MQAATQPSKAHARTVAAIATAAGLSAWTAAIGVNPALACLVGLFSGHLVVVWWRRQPSSPSPDTRAVARVESTANAPLAAEAAAPPWRNTSAAVFTLAADDKILWANPAATTLTKRTDLAGTPVRDVIPTLSSFDFGEVQPGEHMIVASDGAMHSVGVHADRTDDGRTLLVVFDLSTIRSTERNLMFENNLLEQAGTALFDAKVNAEETSRRKTQFLTYASHEIRTPLTAILGFAEQLEDPSLAAAEHKEAVQIIRRNSEHLLTVLSDILDLAKIEADQLEVRRNRCDLRQLLGDVLAMFSANAQERRINLEFQELTALPGWIETDRTRLRQVLINLLGNAVRHSSPGAVAIKIAAQASPPLLRVEIDDRGPRLSPEDLKRMFEPFDQVAATAERRLGNGLGLAISRRLARLLGGDVDARPGATEGNTFTFTLTPTDLAPAREWTQSAAPRARPQEGPTEPLQARVLLAEDGLDNQRLIASILRRAGAEVEIAGDGSLAVAAMTRARAAERPFDMVVMDMQMPTMDGYEATAELRRQGFAQPILALTADALAGARQRCLDVGCNDYASKPIDRQRLVSTVRRMLTVPQAVASAN
jgi:signal transduction histidine kinase/CheY-like chemotaxis protein